MNRADAEAWKLLVLDEVFAAVAASQALTDALVFKGARILHVHLDGGRRSLDIDSNLLPAFVAAHPAQADQRDFLEREIRRAVAAHFERPPKVRFRLANLAVAPKPPKGHPRGWDAFDVRLRVEDLTSRALGLPAIEIDVAAPEELLSGSIGTVTIGGRPVRAYTLERIAGEKMRAFLSTLPAYRAKVRKPGEAVRAKDLYDLARIRRAQPIELPPFWRTAGLEFRTACKSRFVDCAGLATFQENWEATESTYAAATIPKDVPFSEAAETLRAVVTLFELEGILPFSFPLPSEP